MASSGWAFVLQNMEQPPLVGNIPAPLGAALPNRTHFPDSEAGMKRPNGSFL
jgi:hypothetical protein